MVQEDERKLDAMTKRHTELTMVNNNSKLLNEMLDHYDKASCGAPELDLLKELFESCEKMQPKLFRMAAETTDETETGTEAEEEDSSGIMDILNSSDELTRVIDRYKMVIIQGKPDITKKFSRNLSETLLDLELSSQSNSKEQNDSTGLLDEDLLGLNIESKHTETHKRKETSTNQEDTSDSMNCAILQENTVSASTIRQRTGPSIDDLLLDGSPITSTPVLETSNIASHIPQYPSPFIANGGQENVSSIGKTSRQRGLEELDFLGEVAIKSHLPTKNERSPQFAKKNEKLSMNELKQRKMEKALKNSGSKDQISSHELHLLEQPQQASSSQVSPSLPTLDSDIDKDSFIKNTKTLSHSDGASPKVSSPSSSNCDKSNGMQLTNKADEIKKEPIIDGNAFKVETSVSNRPKGK